MQVTRSTRDIQKSSVKGRGRSASTDGPHFQRQPIWRGATNHSETRPVRHATAQSASRGPLAFNWTTNGGEGVRHTVIPAHPEEDKKLQTFNTLVDLPVHADLYTSPDIDDKSRDQSRDYQWLGNYTVYLPSV